MQSSTYNTEGDKKGWVTIALHVLIWLMVFLIPYIFSADMEGGHRREDSDRQSFLYLNTGLNFFWVALFYVNAAFLLPRLIYRRKTGLYVFTLVGCFCLMVLLDDILF